VLRLPLHEVLYLKAELKYVTLRTSNRSYVLDEALSELEQRVGDRFIRVHRNALVAKRAVRALERRVIAGGDEEGGESWAVRVAPIDEWLVVSRRQATAVREALVRTRTRCIALAKALVRRDGLRVPNSTAANFVERLTAVPLAPTLAAELAPLIAVLGPLNVQVEAADARIAALGRTDPIVALLQTAPSIGPVTSSGLVAIADDIGRFPSAHQFEAFLGLVPGERSSGEKRRVGHITKAGNRRARYLLVEAAWRILRSKAADTAVLRAWAQRILHRRGKKIAAVALARRLAGILYAMWRDQRAYDAGQLRMPPSEPVHAA